MHGDNDPLMQAPSKVDEKQVGDYGLRLAKAE